MIRVLLAILFLTTSLGFAHEFNREVWSDAKEDLVYEKNPELEKEKDQPETRENYQAEPSEGSDFSLPKELLYGIVAVLLVGLILLLVKQFSSSMPDEKLTKTVVISDDLDLNEVKKSELELSLEEALKNNDYRLAVRIQFLIGLKAMYENNIIRWKKRKTNYTYANEIDSSDIKSSFLQTIQVFEIAWYGKDTLTEQEYAASNPYFQDFQDTVRKHVNNG